MAGYSYDYSLTPARETGWRSAVTTAATIVAVLAVSTISGAVVTLELLAPQPQHPDSAAAAPPKHEVAAVASAREPAPAAKAPTRAAVPVSDHATASTRAQSPTVGQNQSKPATASVTPPVATPPGAGEAVGAAPVVTAPPATTAVATSQPAPAAAPPAAPVEPAIDAQALPQVPDRDLTFAKGYAQRRAAQQAAAGAQGADRKSAPTPKVAAATQPDRHHALKKARVAQQDPRLDRRRMVREEGFFDFERHQAMAFGDPRQNRRQQRSFSVPVVGGIFDRLF